MRRATRYIITAMMCIAATVGTAARANGDTGATGADGHCGTGDVEAIKNAFYPLLFSADGHANDDAQRCQFRLFAEPSEGICFDERDRFVGGIVLFHELVDRDLVDRYEVAISIADLGGSEPEPVQTPIKAARHPALGPIAWKQWSVTFRGLAPGAYTVATSLSFDEMLVAEFSVEFHVLPHEQAHELGRPASGFEGSVTCPAEVLS